MKLELPSVSYLGKTLIIAAAIGLLAYFIFPALEPSIVQPQWSFAGGLFAAAFLGAFLSSLRLSLTAANTSDREQAETIFVGNLSFKASEEDVLRLFSKYGEVHSVRLMTDRITRKPRGFGFVEMDSRGAKSALRTLNGMEFLGRNLRVNKGFERRPHASD